MAARAGDEAVAAVAEPEALERTVHLSFGDTPAQEYVRQLLADHLIHGWDLAAAIGLDATLDPVLADAVAGWFPGQEQLYRDSGVTGPPVAVPDDAPTGERLLGAFGRDPDWAP